MSFLTRFITDNSTSILLLRHGHIEAEKQKRYIGSTDYPLSSIGYSQALIWRQLLQSVELIRIISSQLQRARTMAELIAADRPIVPEIAPEINEINLGEWEDLTFQESRLKSPLAFKSREANLAYFRPPGGESFADLEKRVLKYFFNLLPRMHGNNLIIGHAGVNRVILCHILGIPLEKLFEIAQDYGTLNIISVKDGNCSVKIFNLKVEELAVSINAELIKERAQ